MSGKLNSSEGRGGECKDSIYEESLDTESLDTKSLDTESSDTESFKNLCAWFVAARAALLLVPNLESEFPFRLLGMGAGAGAGAGMGMGAGAPAPTARDRYEALGAYRDKVGHAYDPAAAGHNRLQDAPEILQAILERHGHSLYTAGGWRGEQFAVGAPESAFVDRPRSGKGACRADNDGQLAAGFCGRLRCTMLYISGAAAEVPHWVLHVRRAVPGAGHAPHNQCYNDGELGPIPAGVTSCINVYDRVVPCEYRECACGVQIPLAAFDCECGRSRDQSDSEMALRIWYCACGGKNSALSVKCETPKCDNEKPAKTWRCAFCELPNDVRADLCVRCARACARPPRRAITWAPESEPWRRRVSPAEIGRVCMCRLRGLPACECSSDAVSQAETEEALLAAAIALSLAPSEAAMPPEPAATSPAESLSLAPPEVAAPPAESLSLAPPEVATPPESEWSDICRNCGFADCECWVD